MVGSGRWVRRVLLRAIPYFGIVILPGAGRGLLVGQVLRMLVVRIALQGPVGVSPNQGCHIWGPYIVFWGLYSVP